MKKLCFVVDLFPPKHKGGTETIALEMAKEFSKKYAVHVVTKWHNRLNENKDCGFNIHGIKTKNYPSLVNFAYTAYSFLKEIKKIRPDIIYARPFTPSGFISVIYSKKNHIPVITQCEGGDVRSGWLKFYEKQLVKYVIKNSTKIVSATEEMAKIIAQDYNRTDVVVIPNGINLKEIMAAKPLTLNYVKPRILFVGRMDKMKGTEYLIKAFLEFSKTKVGSLVLVGEGPLEKDLRAKYEKMKKVFFLGSLDHKVLLSYMKSCDVLVLPAIDEAQGVVLIEALTSGLPIIASNVGGVPELIKKENGILTKPKSPKSINAALRHILNSKAVSLRMKKNNIKKGKYHSWEKICEQYVQLFEKSLYKH